MEDLISKPGAMKSSVWTYFGFVAGGDGCPTLSLMKYYSCCVNVKVSFNIGIFSCIEIFWLRIYRIMKK